MLTAAVSLAVEFRRYDWMGDTGPPDSPSVALGKDGNIDVSRPTTIVPN